MKRVPERAQRAEKFPVPFGDLESAPITRWMQDSDALRYRQHSDRHARDESVGLAQAKNGNRDAPHGLAMIGGAGTTCVARKEPDVPPDSTQL